jgi:hypothetical protein
VNGRPDRGSLVGPGLPVPAAATAHRRLTVFTEPSARSRLETQSDTIGTTSAQTRLPFSGSVDARGRRVGSPPSGGGCLVAGAADRAGGHL